MITLVKIRERQELTARGLEIAPKLSAVGAIKENKEEVLLSEEYTRLVELLEGKDINKISDFVAKHGSVKMVEILQLFSHRLTRRQANNLVI